MKKLLLSPLRLAIGWGLSPRLLGWIGIAMLVLLRLTVGWHFYSEGVDKSASGNWSAAPFFANAKGPLAQHYRQMVWDHDGTLRLNRDRTMLEWAQFRDRIAKHYGFDAEQVRQARGNYIKAVDQYDWVMEQDAADLQEYELGRERIKELGIDPVRTGVESLEGQKETIRREWIAKAAPTLELIDKIWANYEVAQNAVASREQVEAHGPLRIVKPRTGRIDTSVIDRWVPYFDMAVGLCLMLGLFTPVAALAAAGFLGSVFLSQYPPTSGPGSSIYQLIEGVACLVLAGTGAGRFAGLDFFLHMIVRQVWGHPTDQE